MSWFAEHAASGLFDATWTLVWHWGLGIGLIVLCGVGAFFSPIGKKEFIYAGVLIAVVLFIYGYGTFDEKQVCEARIKFIYLDAHPKLNKHNLAKHWTVSKKWQLKDPVTYTPLPRPNTAFGGWGSTE